MLSTRPDITAKLDPEPIGWMTTVTPEGQPQSSPVWFLRDGDDLLVYSQPDTAKLRNIAANPRIAFNLRGDSWADQVVTMEGTATVEPDAPPAHSVLDYLSKYANKIADYGWTAEEFATGYSVRIRITVNRIRE